MKLNLRINDYPIFLNQELNEENLKKHDFKKAGFFDRLIIKPTKDDIVLWAKNCGLKYIDDDFQNSIYPILNINSGAEIMFGTSAYLWFKENKLIKMTFQIIENKLAAEVALEELQGKIIKFVGNPSSSEWPFIKWESENYKFIIEFPRLSHGYIHLMNKIK